MLFNDKLDADEQVSAEEAIARTIRDYIESGSVTMDADGNLDALDDENCADLGRIILLQVLGQFRPDLVEED